MKRKSRSGERRRRPQARGIREVFESRRARIITGIAAAAVVTAVLLLVTIGSPGDNGEPGAGVLVLVNGAEITEKDVYLAQVEYYWTYQRNLSDEDALDLLIVQTAVYHEAGKGGYELTPLQAERRILREWGLTADELRAEVTQQGLVFDEWLEHERVRIVVEDFTDDLFEAIEVSDEEAREFYEELKKEGEDLGPFEEEKEELIWFLRYEQWLDKIGDIREQAQVEYR